VLCAARWKNRTQKSRQKSPSRLFLVFVPLRPNSITLSRSQTNPKLVADLQRDGIWSITSSELARASRSATSLGPVGDQDSVTEFGFEPGRRPVHSQSPLYAILVADGFAAGLSQIQLRYPGRRQVRGWSQTCRRPVADLLVCC